MLPNKRIAFLFCLLLLTFFAKSQQSEQYAFAHYKLADGLSSNIVNNLVQDSSGFIWLSTNNGLQRFDGNKFVTFKSMAGNAGSLPSDEVMQVYLDRHNRLWVLTADNKVGIFNTATFRYTEVPVRQWSRDKVYIDKVFVETANGQLLLHLRRTSRLFQFRASDNTFVPSTAVPFPNHWSVNYLLQEKVTGKYFLSTDSGLVVYNPQTKHVNYQHSNPDKEPLINAYGNDRFLNYLYIDGRRRLFFEQWIKTDIHPVLKEFDLRTGARREINLRKDYGLGYHQIRALLEQRNGRLWLFGLPFLAEYTGGEKPLQFVKKDYSKEGDLKFNQVYSVFEDREKNLWMGTDNGLYLFNPDAQFFHNYTLATPKRFAVEGRAQSALQLPNGEIWIGYRDLGVHRFTQQMHPLPLPPAIVPLQTGISVWDLHLHSKTGKLWMGLQGGKLIIYDTLTRKADLLSPAPFEQRAVTQIVEDRKGNLWFGTQGGNLVKWDRTAGGNKPDEGFSLVTKTGVIEKLFVDNGGNIWVTASGEGLLKVNPESNKIVAQFNDAGRPGYRLWNNNPRDIIQYNDSLLIVASGALNLINLHSNKVVQISNREGLPTNTVQSLSKDAAGMLWLGTMNGLCVADLDKLTFTTYDQSDGLLNDYFNVAGAHALPDGRLLFTSAESILLFNPAETREKENNHKVVITDVKLMNTSLSLDSLRKLKQLNLSYNTTYLVLEFNALNYSKLNKLDYYYQLQGFDTTWVKSDDRHQAIYTSLPSGTYRFRVKTKNLAGEVSPAAVFFELKVNPPFWRTWWFVMIILLLVALVLYLLYRERIKRLITLQEVRSEIASHLHQDVSTTLNNINVLSQIAKLKAEKDIVRSKELIDEISGKSYNMMVSMDEILWSIDPSNDTMEKTLLRLFEFAKTLDSNYGAAIDIVVHEKVKQLRLPMKLRHDFFVFCKSALQHLAQHTRGKSIMVDIDLVWSKILLKILCVGEDTEEELQSMQELKKNMQEKATAMEANLNFDIGKRDTSIILSFPVK